MQRQCSHSFSWPIRALDGRYYRTCRWCGCKHEFDWEKMCGIEQGPSFTDPFLIRKTDDGPSLSLLPARESAVRVFVENLLFCFRSQPRTVVGYRPGMLWRNVFVPSGAPWRWFGRSLLCHAVAIAVVATALRPSKVTARRPGISADSQITYYLRPPTFPAREARPSTTFRRRSSARSGVQAQAALRVAPGRKTASATLTAPQIRFPKAASGGMAALGNGLVAPAPPSSALSQFQLKSVPGGQVAAVGPAPELHENLRGSLTLSQGPIVGPPSNLAGIPSQRRVLGPGSTLVAPPPSVQGIQRSAGGVTIGNSAVVAPAPQIAGVAGNPFGKRGAPGLGGSGDVVAPAPQVAGIGRASYGKSGAAALAGSGDVVAPAPQIAGVAGNPFGKRGSPGLGGSGDVVAPAPQVAGTFSGRGSGLPQSEIVGPAPGTDFHPGLENGKAGSFGVGYVPAVGPAPQVSGLGGGAGGRTGAPNIGSAGASVVAPPPALQGSEITGGSGAGSASAGGGLAVAASAPPVQQPAASNSSEVKAAGELPAPESVDNSPPGSVQEFSLHLVGVASALPASSYFSNYEVFIAERRLTRLKSQLIKLVYMFLPYQRRLSEFGTANLRTLKLRVKRDPSCDESLLDITWPDAASRQQATDANPEANTKAKLPCYRTSADEYRRALAKFRN
jgi:hypothetical protein